MFERRYLISALIVAACLGALSLFFQGLPSKQSKVLSDKVEANGPALEGVSDDAGEGLFEHKSKRMIEASVPQSGTSGLGKPENSWQAMSDDELAQVSQLSQDLMRSNQRFSDLYELFSAEKTDARASAELSTIVEEAAANGSRRYGDYSLSPIRCSDSICMIASISKSSDASGVPSASWSDFVYTVADAGGGEARYSNVTTTSLYTKTGVVAITMFER